MPLIPPSKLKNGIKVAICYSVFSTFMLVITGLMMMSEDTSFFQADINQRDTSSELSVSVDPQASLAVSNTGKPTLNSVRGRRISASSTIIPFQKASNALMLKASLYGTPYQHRRVTGRFILDTGATYTSISRKMALELGLDVAHAPTVRITTANGRIYVPKVTIDRIMINGVEARHVEATVIDVRHDAAFSGLLGLSFIKKFRTTIDPDAGELVFQSI